MIEQLWTLITEQLKHNNFLSGGAVLMVGGWLMHIARAYPSRIYNCLRERFILQLDIPDRSAAFAWMNRWLAEQSYTRNRARLLTVTTRRKQDDRDDSQPEIILSPAPGTHYLIWRRHLVILYRERSDSKNNEGGPTSVVSKPNHGFSSLFPTETFTIRILTRNRKLARELLEEARELLCPRGDDRITIYVGRYGEWNSEYRRLPRPIESVILDGTMMADVRGYIEEFLNREHWYNDRGIPHRLGFLFKGPPGSGKTSAIVALASALHFDIAIINLANRNLDDDELCRLLMKLPKHTFVLIEDIDCIWEQREKNDSDESHVTFSGLLNAIDGVAAAEGRVLFMTSNFPEKLDVALIRPGRVDHQIEIGAASSSQICRLFSRFFPDASPSQALTFVDGIKPGSISMAALQGHLTKYSHSVEDAVHHVGDLNPPKHRHVVKP